FRVAAAARGSALPAPGARARSRLPCRFRRLGHRRPDRALGPGSSVTPTFRSGRKFMATLAFNAFRPLRFPGLEASPYRPIDGGRRPRLAVISTYHDLCGIAGYTRGLERQLGDIFDVTVFNLDQYLLRATHRRVKRFANRHIRDICREIR